MTYNELLTELAVVRAFITKLQYDDNLSEVLSELQEQEQYLLEKIEEFDNK